MQLDLTMMLISSVQTALAFFYCLITSVSLEGSDTAANTVDGSRAVMAVSLGYHCCLITGYMSSKECES